MYNYLGNMYSLMQSHFIVI